MQHYIQPVDPWHPSKTELRSTLDLSGLDKTIRLASPSAQRRANILLTTEGHTAASDIMATHAARQERVTETLHRTLQRRDETTGAIGRHALTARHRANPGGEPTIYINRISNHQPRHLSPH